MPIRLPNIPGVQPAAINAPQMDARAAAAPALALGNLAQSIAQGGEAFHTTAINIQRVENARAVSKARQDLADAYSRRQIELQADPDPASRIRKTEQFFAGYRGTIDSPDLPPAVRDELFSHFDHFATTETINSRVDAHRLAMKRASATFQNEFETAATRSQAEAAARAASSAGILLPEEEARALREWDRRMLERQMQMDMMEDPLGWKESHPLDKPPAGIEPIQWNQWHRQADAILRQQSDEISDAVLDNIVDGKITAPQEIDAVTQGIRPLERQKLKDALERWNTAGAVQRRNDPANISAAVGQFYSRLPDWQPDAEGSDPGGVDLRMLIEELPEGHPMRDKMRESMTARKNRMEMQVKTRADQAMKSLQQAAERGDFGPLKPPAARKVELRKALADGWLKDVNKLQAQGFSREQALEIREAAMTGPSTGQTKFNELWKERPQQSANAQPFDIAVADAVRGENAFLQWDADIPQEELAAHESAVRAYGEAMKEMEQWTRLNPDAPDPAISAKLRELGSKSARLAPQTGPVKPPPSRQPATTSMNLPKPLAPLAPVFETAGRAHGIDPRFLMAIAMHETANGTSAAFRHKRNAMGVSDSNGPIAFDDPAESIQHMARVLASAKGPYRNARTLAQIAAVYAPPGAANDPRGMNRHWTAGVAKYLRQLGADPDRIFTT